MIPTYLAKYWIKSSVCQWQCVCGFLYAVPCTWVGRKSVPGNLSTSEQGEIKYLWLVQEISCWSLEVLRCSALTYLTISREWCHMAGSEDRPTAMLRQRICRDISRFGMNVSEVMQGDIARSNNDTKWNEKSVFFPWGRKHMRGAPLPTSDLNLWEKTQE